MLLCLVLMANALDKRQASINSIKKSREFLYSDITMSSQEDANSQAVELLQCQIFTWAKDRAKNKNAGNVSLIELNKLIDTIMVRRANMYRVFAYVKKVKLVPLFCEWKLTLIDNLDVDDVNDIEGLPEEKSEELASDEESPEQEELPEPKDTILSQISEKKDTVANGEIRSILRKSFWGKKGGVIEQIKKAKNFFELRQIMEPLKEKGDIKDYGKYATAEKPEECYLVVYDPAGNIKALLGKGDKVRPNLKTGRDDSIKNYRGCGAIWFTVNETNKK